MSSQKFQRFDYGYIGNLGKFARISLPDLDISTIDIPIAMFVGAYDTLATPKDNAEVKMRI